ncbi:MAG TPA: galactokinase [Pseudonocardiaceae bacterium]|nr:galactokinase [Pseudonocardiaceae bacterium]
MSVAVRAAAAFSREYGDRPAGCWAAPGRVNLIGEHTDYNAGFVLPFALPPRTAVAASPVRRPEWTVWSEQEVATVSFGAADLVPGRVKGWAAYPAGVVWALREAGFAVPGACLAIASDVPAGAGLSSSAALECAVLTALADLGGLDLPDARRPGLAQRAENAYVGVPCGIMDQSAAVLCRAGHVLFLDCRTLATEQVPLDLAGLAILVVDTRAPHRLVTGEYAARRAACERAACELGVPALRDVPPDALDEVLPRLAGEVNRRRVRHVVTENQRVLSTVALLRAGRVREIGPLLSASHASLRDDFEVSVPELDTAVEAALSAGAYGARMTGGGFGGCVLALVDAAAVEPVSDAVRKAFAAHGFSPPVAFVAPPGAGAGPVSGY